MDLVALDLFLGVAACLWLSTFGYLFFLHVLRLFRRRAAEVPVTLPSIAVVVPTLNEEGGILEKIRDLRRTDYPAEKIRWLVVDGGSRDRTAETVRSESDSDGRLQLVLLPEAGGKAEQVRTILQRLEEEVVVFTDADSRLHPSCIRELVTAILREPGTALVAASVSPAGRLPEERLHWLFLNHLWWLEGEALSCSGLSGVCYALHRPSLLAMDSGARAEDIHLGALACARGLKVRLSRSARAVELRTPHTQGDFLRFRKRRGSCYLAEIIGVSDGGRRTARWRLTRAVRMWQMLGLPWLMAATFLSGAVLLATRFWVFFPAALMAFGVTSYLYALALSRKTPDAPSIPELAFVVLRYIPLLFLSLFRLKRRPETQGPRGGLSPGEIETTHLESGKGIAR